MSEVIRGVIDKSTAQEICDAVKEKEGSTEGVPFNTVADRIRALSVGGGENKLAQIIDRSITEITAEDLKGVTSIGKHAFRDCKTLIGITIPKSVTSIFDCAFYDCSNLKSVYYDGNIDSWCNITFNTSDINLFNNESVLYVRNANDTYEAVIDLVIPDTITTIGKHAFCKYNSLKSVFIGNGVAKLDYGEFIHCRGLTDVTLGTGITQIGNMSFGYCLSLESITIPNNVRSVVDRAFWSCTALASVRIGNGITTIGSNVFTNCHALTDIYIDAPEDSISGAPWGAPNSPTIHWNTPLPSEEV